MLDDSHVMHHGDAVAALDDAPPYTSMQPDDMHVIHTYTMSTDWSLGCTRNRAELLYMFVKVVAEPHLWCSRGT